MADILGALSGIVAGAAFAPFNPPARAAYLVQGATKGALEPWNVAYKGFSAAIGTAALGPQQGIPLGIQGGLPAVIQQSAKPYAAALDTAELIAKYGPWILLAAGGLLLYMAVKE